MFDALLVRLIDELEAIPSDLDPITPDRSGYLTLHRLMGELIAVAERWSSVVEALARTRAGAAAERGKAVGRINQASGGWGSPSMPEVSTGPTPWSPRWPSSP